MSKLKLYISISFSFLLMIGCILVLISTNFLTFTFSIGIPILVVVNLLFLIYWGFKKKIYLLYSLVSLVVYFLCFDSFLQLNFKKDNIGKNSFTLLSYNVRQLNLDKDIKRNNIDTEIVDFVNEQTPDIVSFQEYDLSKTNQFMEYPYRFIGYRIRVDKSLLVIFSKFPIVNSGYLDFPNTLNNAIYVDLLINNKKVRIYNIHLQSFWIHINSDIINYNKFFDLFDKISKTVAVKEEQALMVYNHAKSFDGKVIITGDFNSTQFSSAYNILKKNRKDTFIEVGKGLGSTYKLFNYPLRLDYILTDDGFKVITHKNFDVKLSDHEPILVELAID